jgi:hypothetical protein
VNRVFPRVRTAALAVLLASFLAAPAHAQFGVPWQRVPAVAVIGAEDDPRLAVVDEAIAHWNGILAELGSAFRLGPVKRQVLPIPEEALQQLSRAIPRAGAEQVPGALRGLPGDLRIVLAQSEFISFSGPFDPDGKRVIGIRRTTFPLTLPNVVRNVIAHEIGHAIGLGHNADPAMLMCGRPAPCRPDAFTANEPRFFPLTEAERSRLRSMYPATWKPAAR